jgi:hypothetical protein
MLVIRVLYSRSPRQYSKANGIQKRQIYCDMTPESRNSPLLANGSSAYVSAASYNRVTEELLDMVTYIRFAPKL